MSEDSFENNVKFDDLSEEEDQELIKLLDELFGFCGISDGSLARIFYHLYPDIFIYDPRRISGNREVSTWLIYDDINEDYKICDNKMEKAKKLMSVDMLNIITNDFNNRIENSDDKDLEKKFRSISSRLSRLTDQNHVIEFLKIYYRKDNYCQNMRLKKNPNRGLYEVEASKYRFDGKSGVICFKCPFCATNYKKNGEPYKNARHLVHSHGLSGYELRQGYIDTRVPHCDKGRFPYDKFKRFKVNITENTKRTI